MLKILVSEKKSLINLLTSTVNTRYEGLIGGTECRLSLMSAITQGKGYSWKYTIRYTANTRNKHRNTECDYIKVFYIGVTFLTTKFS
jgi:hypothetical protein